jgi:glucosamine kinase
MTTDDNPYADEHAHTMAEQTEGGSAMTPDVRADDEAMPVDAADEERAPGRAGTPRSRSRKEVIEPLVIGVDGGGSTTRVSLADATGRVLSSATGEGSAIRPGDPAHSAEVIAALVEQVRAAAAQGEGIPPAMLVAGLAGGGQELAARAVERELSRLSLATRCCVVADASIALEDAFGDGPGILLIAGTGSAAFARTPAGGVERCGGWGPNIGDEGSGAWLGRRALSVVTAASDGREPETALIGAILTATEQESLEGLIPWAAGATPATLASLAPVVLATAATGDLRANAVVSMAIEELIVHIRALARRSFVDERAAIQVALAGGLLTRGTLMRKRLEQRLKTAIPGATVLSRDVDAVKGAIRAARRLAGVDVT